MKGYIFAGGLLWVMKPTLAADANQDKVLDLVQQHVEAQRLFDVNKLRAITAENYIEVSPRGEVDPREKMLDFYAPGKKVEAPVVKIEEPSVRVFADTAVVISKLSFEITSQGKVQSFSLRATHMAQKTAQSWKLISAHYSNIR